MWFNTQDKVIPPCYITDTMSLRTTRRHYRLLILILTLCYRHIVHPAEYKDVVLMRIIDIIIYYKYITYKISTNGRLSFRLLIAPITLIGNENIIKFIHTYYYVIKSFIRVSRNIHVFYSRTLYF